MSQMMSAGAAAAAEAAAAHTNSSRLSCGVYGISVSCFQKTLLGLCL